MSSRKYRHRAFFPIFCQRIRVLSATICYIADKLVSKNILSHEKVNENINLCKSIVIPTAPELMWGSCDCSYC